MKTSLAPFLASVLVIVAIPAHAQTAVFQSLGTPTISKTSVDIGGGNAKWLFDATFNVGILARDGDVVLGLPSDAAPSFTTASFTIFVNGVENNPASTASNFAVGYNMPSSGVVMLSNDSFKIAQNNQIVMPVTFMFWSEIDANVYGVRLDDAAWRTLGGSLMSTELGGIAWSTAGVPSSVPEPSAYAAVAGIVALGLAAYRRKATVAPQRPS